MLARATPHRNGDAANVGSWARPPPSPTTTSRPSDVRPLSAEPAPDALGAERGLVARQRERRDLELTGGCLPGHEDRFDLADLAVAELDVTDAPARVGGGVSTAVAGDDRV